MKDLKDKIIEDFTNYYNNFNVEDNNIKRKYYHSLRVMKFSKEIAYSENLNENDIEISIVAGLLHDYARFIQWTKYHTYSDIESIDHGNLGVELLFGQNEILKFYTNVKNFDEIYDAIKYHNKHSVPDTLSQHNKKICYIVRDADKLDIFDIFVNGILDFKEDNAEISEEVKKDFFNNRSINYSIIKNDNDDLILKIAMLFDLKYKYSVDYIVNNKILEKLYGKIKNKEMFKEYFKYMNDYLLSSNHII